MKLSFASQCKNREVALGIGRDTFAKADALPGWFTGSVGYHG
jgi:hypothetical protein